MFVTAGFEGVRELMSPAVFTFIMGGLSLVAGYFKLNPSQNYGE